jgi:hypothetical protein
MRSLSTIDGLEDFVTEAVSSLGAGGIDSPVDGLSSAALMARGSSGDVEGAPPLAVGAPPEVSAMLAADCATGIASVTTSVRGAPPGRSGAGIGAEEAISKGHCGVLTGRRVASATPSATPSFERRWPVMMGDCRGRRTTVAGARRTMRGRCASSMVRELTVYRARCNSVPS